MSVNIVKLSSGEVLIDLSGDSVKPEVLVEGETTHDAAGDLIRGTMPDRGTVNASIDGMTTTSYTIPAGKHSGSGKVSLTDDIGNALAEISGGSGLSVPAHIDRINDELSDQTDLIAQIKNTLSGKAGNSGGSAPVIESLQVTQNGTYAAPAGVNGYSPVVVNVPVPDGYIKPSGTLQVTKNGEYDVKDYASVNVNIPSSGGGGGFVYPDGAFAPVTTFTDGKQYALVAVIDGVRRYINTTTYNNYTMNATQIAISEDAGDYVIFADTPALFTAVASGNGFLLQNGNNYLHGTTSNGTALRVGTTQAVWTVDTSETGGFASGKYYAKEDANAVWLFNNTGGYDWSIKFETAGSFGFDRSGRDNTYSTGFVSFVLYEYVAGEGELDPIVDTSDANVTADKMLAGYSGYAKGQKVEGSIQLQSKTAKANGTVTADAGYLLESVIVDVPAGGSSGFVVKSGTTTSGTINTGLSSVDQFFIYKESVTATGLIHLHYTKSATSRMYASAWSTQNYGTKTITNGTGGVTISGGTVTISATQATQGALTSNVTYKWIAVGTE